MTNEQARTFLLQLNADKRLNKSEYEAVRVAIKALERADLEGYSSRLWKAAYERGKAEAEQASALGKIRSEIVHLHDWAFSREEILRIIDKYRAGSEDKECR